MRPAKLAQPLFDDRRIGEDPPIDGAVVDLEAALAEHLLKISIAERVTQIPGHRLHDQPCLEMSSLEIILRLALQRKRCFPRTLTKLDWAFRKMPLRH